VLPGDLLQGAAPDDVPAMQIRWRRHRGGFRVRRWWRRTMDVEFSSSHGDSVGRYSVHGANRGVVEAPGHVLGQRGSVQLQGWGWCLRLRPAGDPVPTQRGVHSGRGGLQRRGDLTDSLTVLDVQLGELPTVIGAGGTPSVQPGRRRAIPAASSALVTRQRDCPRRWATSSMVRPSVTNSCRRLSTVGGAGAFQVGPRGRRGGPVHPSPACGPGRWNR
jgi:hypothetical protein